MSSILTQKGHFDTLEYSKQLEENGFSQEQAQIQAKLMLELTDGVLVTKQHLDEASELTRKEIENYKIATRRDIDNLKLSVKRDIEESSVNHERVVREWAEHFNKEQKHVKRFLVQDFQELKAFQTKDFENTKREVIAAVLESIQMLRKNIDVAIEDKLKKGIDTIEKNLSIVDNNIGRVSENLNVVDNNIGRVSENLNVVDNNIGRVSENLNVVDNNIGRVSDNLNFNNESITENKHLLDQSTSDVKTNISTFSSFVKNEFVKQQESINRSGAQIYGNVQEVIVKEVDGMKRKLEEIPEQQTNHQEEVKELLKSLNVLMKELNEKNNKSLTKISSRLFWKITSINVVFFLGIAAAYFWRQEIILFVVRLLKL